MQHIQMQPHMVESLSEIVGEYSRLLDSAQLLRCSKCNATVGYVDLGTASLPELESIKIVILCSRCGEVSRHTCQ